jgi:hypothetical protein
MTLGIATLFIVRRLAGSIVERLPMIPLDAQSAS